MVPDISWIVPPSLRWYKKYKFDLNSRGHITRIPEPATNNFLSWNAPMQNLPLKANLGLLLSDKYTIKNSVIRLQ